MTARVIGTGPFGRDVRRLKNAEKQLAVREALKRFQKDRFDTRLKFEGLVNRKGFFSIRSDYATRILLFKIDEVTFEAIAVGNHDYIYKNSFR